MKIPAILALGMFSLAALTWSAPALALEQDAADSKFDLYWSKNREIRVIQKRRHLKEARWEGTFFTGVIPNDDFWIYFPVGVSGGYFLTETVGIEVNAAYVSRTNSDLLNFLRDSDLGVLLPQQLQWHSGVSGIWSPFHGKVGLFASKLFHFDFSVIFGVGVIGTGVKELEQNPYEGKIDISGNLGAGFRTWLDKDVALRIEYRHYFYPAEGGGVSFPVEFIVGASYFFGGVE